jgi:hypothetical protein
MIMKNLYYSQKEYLSTKSKIHQNLQFLLAMILLLSLSPLSPPPSLSLSLLSHLFFWVVLAEFLFLLVVLAEFLVVVVVVSVVYRLGILDRLLVVVVLVVVVLVVVVLVVVVLVVVVLVVVVLVVVVSVVYRLGILDRLQVVAPVFHLHH